MMQISISASNQNQLYDTICDIINFKYFSL